MTDHYSLRRKIAALYRVGQYRPRYAAAIVVLSIAAAALEGIGLSFLLPIVESFESGGSIDPSGGLLGVFQSAYAAVGVPFTMGYLVAGVMVAMTIRYSLSFVVAWLRAAIRVHYVTHIRVVALDRALDAKMSYFDQEGSDEILNAIITEANYAGKSINTLVSLTQRGLLAAVYLTIALYFAPVLTVIVFSLFGTLVLGSRYVVESGYSVGDRLATANERIQRSAQAGTQGIGAVKLFGLKSRIRSQFADATEQYTDAKIQVERNKAAITDGYQLAAAISLFALIYLAFAFANLSLASFGVFLFAIFRLTPMINSMNESVYDLEQRLPHLIRVQEFTDELSREREPSSGSRSLPVPVDTVEMADVSFAYPTSERVLSNISFEVSRGEFIAFVGPSGAGKSTIASLLTRLYEPDSGRIYADGIPIDEVDMSAWRDRVSIVRQQPHLFNATLAENVMIGRSDATRQEVEQVCSVAEVDEFVDDLEDGYDTELGDNGIRLSGGQRQRVAIARALLKDADLLVMDEATSDLDTALEKRVHTAIERMDRDFALVVIAHRLSTVTDADRIYTVEDGFITETGGHGELLEAGGQYADFYALQAETN